MRIDILTLFPEMFKGPFDESIIKRAQQKELVEINIYNLRKWATDKHKTVDDRPFGGGVGMILKVDVLYDAVMANLGQAAVDLAKDKFRVVLLDATGERFNQKKAIEYSKLDYLLLISGHYEGIDYRVHEYLADDVISVGDYVLTGGELPAMTVTDAVVRLIPGVLEKKDATKYESFSDIDDPKLLEYPQYTRPSDFMGWKVPEVLLSGNHAEIEAWKKEKSLEATKKTAAKLRQNS